MNHILKTSALLTFFVAASSIAAAQKTESKQTTETGKTSPGIEAVTPVAVKADDINSKELQKTAAAQAKKTTSAASKKTTLPETIDPASKNIKVPSEEINPQKNPEPKPSPKIQKEGK